jgi:hypothetical protein
MEKVKRTLYQIRHPIAAMEADIAQRTQILNYESDVITKLANGFPINLQNAKEEIDRRYNMLGFFGIASHNAKVVAKGEIELAQTHYDQKFRKQYEPEMMVIPKETIEVKAQTTKE